MRLSDADACMQAGMIVDDELNRLLVNPLPPRVRLHAIVDACHSGTVLDLEYRCKVKSDGIHWKMEYDHQPVVYKVGLHVSCRTSRRPQAISAALVQSSAKQATFLR
jgi:hypothetical protein